MALPAKTPDFIADTSPDFIPDLTNQNALIDRMQADAAGGHPLLREATLGALGTVLPESQHPLQDAGRSLLQQSTDPAELAKTAAFPIYPLVKAGIGLGKQAVGALGEAAPALSKLTPGGGWGGTITEDEAERAVHGTGTIAGMAAPLALPALREGAVESSAPLRTRLAERITGSMTGPEYKNTPPTSALIPAVTREAPIAWTEQGYAQKINDLKAQRIAELNQAVARTKGQPQVPLASVVNRPVGVAAGRALKAGKPNASDAVLKWGQDYQAANPDKLSVPNLLKTRRNLGKDLNLFNQAGESDTGIREHAAQQKVYHRMNDIIDTRIPGAREYGQHEAGLIRAGERLADKARVAQGRGLLPNLRGYFGLGGEGETFEGVRLPINIPFTTGPKTLAVRALRPSNPLPALTPPPAPPAPPYLGAVRTPPSLRPIPRPAPVPVTPAPAPAAPIAPSLRPVPRPSPAPITPAPVAAPLAAPSVRLRAQPPVAAPPPTERLTPTAIAYKNPATANPPEVPSGPPPTLPRPAAPTQAASAYRGHLRLPPSVRLQPGEQAAVLESRTPAPVAPQAAPSPSPESGPALMERRDLLQRELEGTKDQAHAATLQRQIVELNRAIEGASAQHKAATAPPATPWGKRVRLVDKAKTPFEF